MLQQSVGNKIVALQRFCKSIRGLVILDISRSEMSRITQSPDPQTAQYRSIPKPYYTGTSSCAITPPMERFDLVIVGGGIIGLATAFAFHQRFPNKRVVLVEKEAELAQHQTGHNSGVIHAGTYYKPGSLKATNCRLGKNLLQEFCQAEGIRFEICGKIIVAIEEWERPILRDIFERGKKNGVECELIGRERISELEPHAAGIEAIHVRDEGIVSYPEVCRHIRARLEHAGVQIRTGSKVVGACAQGQSLIINTSSGDIEGSVVVNCAGLYCDRVARLLGYIPPLQIVPFRGEYYELTEEARPLCRNLIYPVPNPNFPFLGVHFTRMMDNRVKCGPNAVFAFRREGYRAYDLHLGELIESLSYPGFLRLAAKYWAEGAQEFYRSFSKQAFLRALQRMVPNTRAEHLLPGPTGVRAQAISPDGKLVDDFLIETHGRAVHVLNAPSPAATSAFNIGRVIVDAVERLH